MTNESPDLYRLLKVDPTADRATIRAAYLAAARKFHPDNTATTAVDPAHSEGRIRELNEAWRILGNDQRRAEYDAVRKRHAAIDKRAAAHSAHDSDTEPTSGDGGEFVVASRTVALLLQHLPWLIAAVVLLGIVVITAFAVRSTDSDGLLDVGDCITIIGPGAHTEAPCDGNDDGVIVEVRDDDLCTDPSARPFEPRSASAIYCIVPPDG